MERNQNKGEDVKNSLLRIFHNFAKFSEEEKDFYISQTSLTKVLRTVNILESSSIAKYFLKQNDVDLIFKKVKTSSHRLDSNEFMNFVAILASKLDPNSFVTSPKQAVVKLIKNYFEPFSQLIQDQEIQDINSIGILIIYITRI
jgi:hypothetical protein